MQLESFMVSQRKQIRTKKKLSIQAKFQKQKQILRSICRCYCGWFLTACIFSGRWWIVGSAWSGREDETNTTGVSSTTKEDNKLLSLAKQQRMSTEIRKNIFCIVMSSEVNTT